MIKGVLLDLAGVIYSGNSVIAGAPAAIMRLRQGGLPVRFITNSTRTPKGKLLARLRGFGIEVEPDELFTPAQAACDWLNQHHRAPHLLIHPDLQPDFDTLGDFPDKAVVIGDAGEYFTYAALNEAFRQLHAGAAFLALANNRIFQDSDGELSLDAGAFVAALEYAARKPPIILGKPSKDFFDAAATSMGCPLADTVMIGDDAEMDIAGALNVGLGQAILVRTGKYTTGVEETVQPKPTAVMEDIAEAVDWVMRQN